MHMLALQVASHPNIYILDTPGILAPRIIDAEICAKLALTGNTVNLVICFLPSLSWRGH